MAREVSKEKVSQRIDKYEVFGKIGQGKFTKIRYGNDTETGERVAIKSVHLKRLENAGLMDDFKKEIAIMKICNENPREHPGHPNVMSIKQILPTSERVFIVVDLMNGGNLKDLLLNSPDQKLEEVLARYYFRQIAAGIEHCHSLGISHGNLKLDNILLNQNGEVLKISNFGNAHLDVSERDNDDKSLRSARSTESRLEKISVSTKGLSSNYLAPEIINDEVYDRKRLDIWSMGVGLYTLVSGELPFDVAVDDKRPVHPTEHLVELFKLIRDAAFRPYPLEFSFELCSLLDGIFVRNPAERLLALEVRQHEWCTNPAIPNVTAPNQPKKTASSPIEDENESGWGLCVARLNPMCFLGFMGTPEEKGRTMVRKSQISEDTDNSIGTISTRSMSTNSTVTATRQHIAEAYDEDD